MWFFDFVLWLWGLPRPLSKNYCLLSGAPLSSPTYHSPRWRTWISWIFMAVAFNISRLISVLPTVPETAANPSYPRPADDRFWIEDICKAFFDGCLPQSRVSFHGHQGSKFPRPLYFSWSQFTDSRTKASVIFAIISPREKALLFAMMHK